MVGHRQRIRRRLRRRSHPGAGARSRLQAVAGRTGPVVTTVAWWHCFAGIAGDMALGSLVDAGADLALVERELAALPVGGWSVEAVPVLRAGLACTHVRVRTRDTQVVRTHAHIVGLITEARLPDRARQRALATFARLAEVEGRLHRRPPAQVHFHEVGRHRRHHRHRRHVRRPWSCSAWTRSEPARWPRVRGSSTPPTATCRSPPRPWWSCCEGRRPMARAIPVELTTPTGAALLAALCAGWGPMPAMDITASGFGAGSRELDGLPNVVQVVIGTAADRSGIDPEPRATGGHARSQRRRRHRRDPGRHRGRR